jgi:hypothetical protein
MKVQMFEHPSQFFAQKAQNPTKKNMLQTMLTIQQRNLANFQKKIND